MYIRKAKNEDENEENEYYKPYSYEKKWETREGKGPESEYEEKNCFKNKISLIYILISFRCREI